MTKENNSYQNPIRFRNSSTNSDNYEQGSRVFQQQLPGYFVQDALFVYFSTPDKSTSGARIWNRVGANGELVGGNYVLIKTTFNKDNTVKSVTKRGNNQRGSATVNITIPAVNIRLNSTMPLQKSLGTFVFILLSNFETTAPSSPTGTNIIPIDSIDSNEYTFAANIIDALDKNAQMYAYLSDSTNGRSGQPTSGVATGNTPATTPQSPPTPGSAAPSSQAPSGSAKGRRPKTAGGKSTPAQNNTSSPSNSTIVVKLKPDKNIFNGTSLYSGYVDKPYIEQTITLFRTELDERNQQQPTRERIVRRHVFEIIPNSFEFSQLSSGWNEVERSGNYSLVDWAKYNLTTCSFRFLVASRRVDTVTIGATTTSTLVNDGMDVSIEQELENIRIIGGSPSPVKFYNFNKLLSTSYRFPYLDNTRGIQWVIRDMSVTATRLTPNGRGIAAAEVSITLNEYPQIARDIVSLPPLSPDRPTPKQCNPKPCEPQVLRDGFWTPNLTIQRDALETTEAK